MSKNDDIEIFHRTNKLKTKAGLTPYSNTSGVIDPSKVQRAQKIIDKKEEDYPAEVKAILTQLQKSWSVFKTVKGDERESALDKIYNYSNNIKDLTSMYDHDLMSHFGLSLRNFCEKIDIDKKEHQVIVQAHIDVMLVTYQEKLRSDKSEKAEELKKVVALAIAQNS